MNKFKTLRDNEDSLKNHDIWKTPNDFSISQMQVFFDNAYSTKELGSMLYDGNYLELSKAIKKDIFMQSFSKIVESFDSTGTYESLITIIKSIFGEDCEMEFLEPYPAVLYININQHSSTIFNWVTKTGNKINATSGSYIVFQSFINQILLDDVVSLFNKFLRPAGVTYKVRISYS